MCLCSSKPSITPPPTRRVGESGRLSPVAASSARVGGTTVAGVQRGMDGAPRGVTQNASPAGQNIAGEAATKAGYAAGDHVIHKKFGRGAVIRVSGQGAQARIMIRFDDQSVGVKEFALSIAPIVRAD